MSKKNIEKHIPKALEVLNKKFKDGEVPKAYNGYISSFGASIIQSGLKATLAMFENTNAGTKEDKKVLIKLILEILGEDGDSLLKCVIDSKNEQYLKQQILDISIAIKLAIRTFKLGD